MVLCKGTLQYRLVRRALAQSDLTAIAAYMFWLMFRNIASHGFVFEDPVNTGVLSQPGCVLASPSWEYTTKDVSQDYIYNWTRDSAIAAIELAVGPLPTSQPLNDYVQFAQSCQNSVMRSQWADPSSTYFYPINGADQQHGIGTLLGRYPGDVYDGDTDAQVGDHPWAVSTANFAELYYRLAGQVTTAGTVPLDGLSAGFFSQVGVDASTTPTAAAAALQGAGDQMLQAVIFHSDDLELSEQLDATTGYEKSVSNLTWSYASFLSAVRARTAI